MKSKEELGEELCNNCLLKVKHRGIKNYGNGPIFCFESSFCDDAYNNYLDLSEECIICGEPVHPDDSEYIQKAADDEYGPICQKCLRKKGMIEP